MNLSAIGVRLCTAKVSNCAEEIWAAAYLGRIEALREVKERCLSTCVFKLL